jgi:intracellular sulfur oxidation DsrE/DsrF family protein
MTDELRPRRTFLSQFGAGAAALGAVVGSSVSASAQTSVAAPARHTEDDWLDQLPARHRIVFDTTTPTGAEDARRYASNFFTANRTGYGLATTDVGVVLILRHQSTAFGYNDAMWAKYGAALSEELKYTDPRTKAAPVVNALNASGESLDALSGQGAHFAVCSMATRRLAGILARKAGTDTEAVFKELSANLIRNAHLVPAGIVTMNRAHERGYTFAYGG